MITNTTASPVSDQIAGATSILIAIAETIRELKRIPSGHLYALLMPRMTHAQYEEAIGILERAGVVRKIDHELAWIGKDEPRRASADTATPAPEAA
jgi:hypothetical protein